MCDTCGRILAASTGTACYRVRITAELVTAVLTLPSHGCPLQAIVATSSLEERPVAAWVARAGAHCQQVHACLVQQGQSDLQHVQADGLWFELVGQWVWMAHALAVPAPALGAAGPSHRAGPLPARVAPQRPGRPPKQAHPPARAVVA